jgi:hypothetical protein
VEACKISNDDIQFELYIHENADLTQAKKYWYNTLDINNKLLKIVFKKHNISTNRRYYENKYYGQIRVIVKKSTDFNRKILGWVAGISDCINIAGSFNGRTSDFGSDDSRFES